MQEIKVNETEQIELLSFHPVVLLRDILRRWYIIVISAIIAGMIAYVVADIVYVPAYSTTTTFVVSTQGNSTTVFQNLSAASNLATVFSEILNSSLLRSAVLKELGMESFDGTISASAIAETNLLTMRITASDPRTAFLVTQAVIDNHQIVSYQVLGSTILEVLQYPKVPVAPVNPNVPLSYMKKAALGAAAVVIMLLAVLSYCRDTVRSKCEAERKLDCVVLGEIGHERKYKTLSAALKQRKTSILITSPSSSFLFVESIRKLRRRVEQQMPKDGRVLLVTSVAENEGKSTVSVNLALAMAQKNKRVLLIDCDLRKPACYKILKYRCEGAGTMDVVAGNASLENTAVQMKNTSLYLLLQRKSVRNSTEISGSDGMAALIQNAKDHFDFVILDTPPMSVASDVEYLMEFADGSLLIVQQNVVMADVINHAVTALRGAESKFLGCVMNNEYGSHFLQGGRYGYGYGYGYGRYGKYGKYNGYIK